LEVTKRLHIFAKEKLLNKMRRPEVVKQIKQTIEKTEPTATTILYGSEARGDARADSDIDVLILLEGDKRDFRREEELSGALYDLELNTGVLISPMIILRKQWENRPFKTPFYINVMNEGIKL
jgi:predicted nucleotidyltransferase